MKIKDIEGGMLLYTIITAMVISFTTATLTLLILNQTIMAENEIKRKEAYQLLRSGYDYVYDILDSGGTVPSSVTIDGHVVDIVVTTPDPDGLSDYQIVITTEY